jgi:hypothetical protein
LSTWLMHIRPLRSRELLKEAEEMGWGPPVKIGKWPILPLSSTFTPSLF